jgi:hypothetical protein
LVSSDIQNSEELTRYYEATKNFFEKEFVSSICFFKSSLFLILINILDQLISIGLENNLKELVLKFILKILIFQIHFMKQLTLNWLFVKLFRLKKTLLSLVLGDG